MPRILNNFRDNLYTMKNLLQIIALSCLLFSCKQLDGHYSRELVDDCRALKSIIEGELLPINKERGLHYVNVDTVNCVLNVRFDQSLDSLSWLEDSLQALGYLPIEIVDTASVVVDSTVVDSLVVSQPIEEQVEEVV